MSSGESFGRSLAHAIWRSVALILPGIFLSSLERGTTYWTFADTLTEFDTYVIDLRPASVPAAAPAPPPLFESGIASTYGRGDELLSTAYAYLDLAPKGRDEEGLPFPSAWWRHHDKYEDKR